MYQQFYSGSALLSLPLVAMALFMGTFAVVVWRTLRRRSRDPQQDAHLARLPLCDDEPLPQAPPASRGAGHA